MEDMVNAPILTCSLNRDNVCWLLYHADDVTFSPLISTDGA
jgi:hypothetical protein